MFTGNTEVQGFIWLWKLEVPIQSEAFLSSLFSRKKQDPPISVTSQMKANYKKSYEGLWNTLCLHMLKQNNSMECLGRLDVKWWMFCTCDSWKPSITIDKERWSLKVIPSQESLKGKNIVLFQWQLQPQVYSAPLSDYLLQPDEKNPLSPV